MEWVFLPPTTGMQYVLKASCLGAETPICGGFGDSGRKKGRGKGAVTTQGWRKWTSCRRLGGAAVRREGSEPAVDVFAQFLILYGKS